MKKLTTTDICTELGVSRSTFKGWVYDILDRTQEQNDKTELEFTEDEIAKLWLIRFYKQLKYSNSQIKEILNNPDFDITKTLLHQIEELNSQKNEIDNLIKVATIMKNTGKTPTSIRFGFNNAGKPKYEGLLTLLGALSECKVLLSKENVNLAYTISKEEAELLDNSLKKIMRIAKCDIGPGHYKVQEFVQPIHNIISKYVTESLCVLYWNIIFLAHGTDITKKFDDEYCNGYAAFICDALKIYCESNSNNPIDKPFESAMSKLESLAIHKYQDRSDKVQAEVHKLYRFVKRINKQPDENCIAILRNFGAALRAEEYQNSLNNGFQKFTDWFIGSAIEIYCNNANEKL